MTSASPRASALPVLLTIGTSSTATGARTPVRAPFAERAHRGRATGARTPVRAPFAERAPRGATGSMFRPCEKTGYTSRFVRVILAQGPC